MIPYEPSGVVCTLCGGDIYRGETYYDVQGECICQGCLRDYAAQVFAPCAVKGGAPWQSVTCGSGT